MAINRGGTPLDDQASKAYDATKRGMKPLDTRLAHSALRARDADKRAGAKAKADARKGALEAVQLDADIKKGLLPPFAKEMANLQSQIYKGIEQGKITSESQVKRILAEQADEIISYNNVAKETLKTLNEKVYKDTQNDVAFFASGKLNGMEGTFNVGKRGAGRVMAGFTYRDYENRQELFEATANLATIGKGMYIVPDISKIDKTANEVVLERFKQFASEQIDEKTLSKINSTDAERGFAILRKNVRLDTEQVGQLRSILDEVYNSREAKRYFTASHGSNNPIDSESFEQDFEEWKNSKIDALTQDLYRVEEPSERVNEPEEDDTGDGNGVYAMTKSWDYSPSEYRGTVTEAAINMGDYFTYDEDNKTIKYNEGIYGVTDQQKQYLKSLAGSFKSELIDSKDLSKIIQERGEDVKQAKFNITSDTASEMERSAFGWSGVTSVEVVKVEPKRAGGEPEYYVSATLTPDAIRTGTREGINISTIQFGDSGGATADMFRNFVKKSGKNSIEAEIQKLYTAMGINAEGFDLDRVFDPDAITEEESGLINTREWKPGTPGDE